MKIDRLVLLRLLGIAAGCMDTATGLGLVVSPDQTLRLMGVDVAAPQALPYLRFVGAFVGSVGLAYLWGCSADSRRLRTVLSVMIFPRLGAGLYVAGAVAAHTLQARWLVVTATDLGVALTQGILLALTRNL